MYPVESRLSLSPSLSLGKLLSSIVQEHTHSQGVIRWKDAWAVGRPATCTQLLLIQSGVKKGFGQVESFELECFQFG